MQSVMEMFIRGYNFTWVSFSLFPLEAVALEAALCFESEKGQKEMNFLAHLKACLPWFHWLKGSWMKRAVRWDDSRCLRQTDTDWHLTLFLNIVTIKWYCFWIGNVFIWFKYWINRMDMQQKLSLPFLLHPSLFLPQRITFILFFLLEFLYNYKEIWICILIFLLSFTKGSIACHIVFVTVLHLALNLKIHYADFSVTRKGLFFLFTSRVF